MTIAAEDFEYVRAWLHRRAEITLDPGRVGARRREGPRASRRQTAE